MTLKNILLIPLIFLLACSKSKPDLIPSKATLVSPLPNEACTTGSVISSTQSLVTFKWESSENTSSYELTIKNMLTGVSTIYNTVETLNTISIDLNTPYSWYVVSRSSSSSNKSEVWKFYNSGPGTITYAPFPAEILTPSMGENIARYGGNIKLEWLGSDVDKDIVGYDIYFGTFIPMPLLKSNLSESFLADVPVSSQTVYYWKVVTKDKMKNTSESVIYQFKVN